MNLKTILLGLWTVAAFVMQPPATAPAPQAQMGCHAVISVEPGKCECIRVEPGDVIQVTPFSWPITRKYANCTIDCKIIGEPILVYIGQVTNFGDVDGGHASQSAFLLVKSEGDICLELRLRDYRGKTIVDYFQEYHVQSHPLEVIKITPAAPESKSE